MKKVLRFKEEAREILIEILKGIGNRTLTGMLMEEVDASVSDMDVIDVPEGMKTREDYFLNSVKRCLGYEMLKFEYTKTSANDYVFSINGVHLTSADDFSRFYHQINMV